MKGETGGVKDPPVYALWTGWGCRGREADNTQGKTIFVLYFYKPPYITPVGCRMITEGGMSPLNGLIILILKEKNSDLRF